VDLVAITASGILALSFASALVTLWVRKDHPPYPGNQSFRAPSSKKPPNAA
jgi:hypothetical protein